MGICKVNPIFLFSYVIYCPVDFLLLFAANIKLSQTNMIITSAVKPNRNFFPIWQFTPCLNPEIYPFSHYSNVSGISFSGSPKLLYLFWLTNIVPKPARLIFGHFWCHWHPMGMSLPEWFFLNNIIHYHKIKSIDRCPDVPEYAFL